MNTYIESKKALDKIREDFCCKGDIIFRTAIQYVVEYGQRTFKDYDFVMNQMAEIDEELKRLEKCSEENEELLSTLRLVAETLYGLKGDNE